jgi:hypothetical protein
MKFDVLTAGKVYVITCFRYGSKNTSEPDSSVSAVSGYGLDDRAIEVESPAKANGLL